MKRRYKRRFEKTRKQKKLRWIRTKNMMRRYSDCNYGDFYCDHYLEGREEPALWIDFRFFHSKLRRYFAVALRTASLAAFDIAEGRAIDEAYEAIPHDESVPDFIEAGVNPKYGKVLKLNDHPDLKRRLELTKTLTDEYLELEYSIRPEIEILNYGPVAVGVLATVNKEFIDEHTIREFIEHFRSLGEPTKPGWKWQDEEVKIIPKKFKRARKRNKAS